MGVKRSFPIFPSREEREKILWSFTVFPSIQTLLNKSNVRIDLEICAREKYINQQIDVVSIKPSNRPCEVFEVKNGRQKQSVVMLQIPKVVEETVSSL